MQGQTSLKGIGDEFGFSAAFQLGVRALSAGQRCAATGSIRCPLVTDT